MSFVSFKEIAYRCYKHEIYKYQTTRELTYKLNWHFPNVSNNWIEIKYNNILVIKPLYCWDGASGPTLDYPTTLMESLVHDALYQLIREKLLDKKFRKTADIIFKDMLRNTAKIKWEKKGITGKVMFGLCYIRSVYYYYAVRAFGKYCV